MPRRIKIPPKTNRRKGIRNLSIEECIHGHTPRVNNSSGNCKECGKLEARKRRKENPQLQNSPEALIKINERRWNKKRQAIKYLGGKCVKCGIIDHPCIFDFHHLDPSKKEKGLGILLTSNKWERIQEELDKCVLLCANCHRKIHFE